MNILFITHRVPYPPNRGDKLRAFHILRFLARRHKITLLCVVDDKEDFQYLAPLEEFCRQVDAVALPRPLIWLRYIFYFLTGRSLTLAHYYSAKFSAKIKQLLAKRHFDLIYIYSSAMSQYVLGIDNPPQVLDLVDVDSEKWFTASRYKSFPLNLVYKLEGKRLSAHEKKAAGKAKACILVSEAEKAILSRHICHPQILNITNGIEPEKYKPYLKGRKDEQSLIFVGGMFYYPYIDGMLYFCREIFPLIRETCPQVKLYIVGSKPAGSIRRLDNDPQITVTGFVEDVRPYIRQATVCVIPLRIAPGIQNKILEAMAMQVPVVSTTSGITGLLAKPNRDLLVADTPREFARRVVELLKDAGLRKQLIHNSYQLIQDKYNWERNLAPLEDIINRGMAADLTD